MPETHTYENIKQFIEVDSNSGCKLLSDNYKNSVSQLIIQCRCGSIFEVDFDHFKFRHKQQCNICGFALRNKNKIFTLSQIKEKLYLLEYKMLFENDYLNTRKNIGLEDRNGYRYNIPYYRLLNEKYSPNKFHSGNPYTVFNIHKWIKDNNKNFKLISTTYISSITPLLWKCDICHEEWDSCWNNILNGQGCPYCVGKRVGRLNNFAVYHPDLVQEWDYSVNTKSPECYAYSSNKKVGWVCKECGNKWVTSIGKRHNGRGCPECATSKGEKVIKQYLEEKDITFKPQYEFSDLLSDKGNPLRFDFMIFKDQDKTQIWMALEYDGIFHFEKQYENDGSEVVQYHDKLKNEYCEKYNIPLLRIPYWEKDNIESILTKELNLKEVITT